VIAETAQNRSEFIFAALERKQLKKIAKCFSI